MATTLRGYPLLSSRRTSSILLGTKTIKIDALWHMILYHFLLRVGAPFRPSCTRSVTQAPTALPTVILPTCTPDDTHPDDTSSCTEYVGSDIFVGMTLSFSIGFKQSDKVTPYLRRSYDIDVQPVCHWVHQSIKSSQVKSSTVFQVKSNMVPGQSPSEVGAQSFKSSLRSQFTPRSQVQGLKSVSNKMSTLGVIS
ncbi:hypothetical protein THAOC_05272 [Thalassiosira oceanica]|uniref:Uncharacterized protein n=1 Tax=Thalassiosira oceanica TaxID=159749 RepID=K0T388_THAOC|nr:hypothetical protein THAOC_05272 [Thalassiosira oceanica]|eukprot:EJK73123.1 hypothetical protein THAOC_05272 [Thalassiosira oceanica]